MIDNLNNLSGIEFENLCQNVLESLGFATETTKATDDGGIILSHIVIRSFFQANTLFSVKDILEALENPSFEICMEWSPLKEQIKEY